MAGLKTRARRAVHAARVGPMARAVKRDNLTYLSWAKLRSLERALADVLERPVPGDLIEAGVARGGSAILLASQLDGDRRFAGYDVFGMIPEPSERDSDDAHSRYETIRSGGSRGLGGDQYYGYADDLLGDVRQAFGRHGVQLGDRVELRPGLFEDTLRPERAIALAHIDCDWHDPVLLCLERIYPWLSPGGYLIADDYHDYDGCARACHEFLARSRTCASSAPDRISSCGACVRR